MYCIFTFLCINLKSLCEFIHINILGSFQCRFGNITQTINLKSKIYFHLSIYTSHRSTDQYLGFLRSIATVPHRYSFVVLSNELNKELCSKHYKKRTDIVILLMLRYFNDFIKLRQVKFKKWNIERKCKMSSLFYIRLQRYMIAFQTKSYCSVVRCLSFLKNMSDFRCKSLMKSFINYWLHQLFPRYFETRNLTIKVCVLVSVIIYNCFCLLLIGAVLQ